MSLAWIMLVALILFGIAVFLTKTRRRLIADKNQRETLKADMTALRLSKMVSYLGADLEQYVRTVPTDDINKRIRQCAACDAVEVCDRCLKDGMIISNMHFCPNYRSLMEDSQRLAKDRKRKK